MVIAIVTGGGVGYDEFVQLNNLLLEERLYDNNHTPIGVVTYLCFGVQCWDIGGWIPRWRDSQVGSEHFFDSVSWHTGLHFGIFLLRYQQHSVLDNNIHSVMIGLGNNLLQVWNKERYSKLLKILRNAGFRSSFLILGCLLRASKSPD